MRQTTSRFLFSKWCTSIFLRGECTCAQLTLTAQAKRPTGFAARSLRAFKCKIQALEIITKHIMLDSVAARSAARSAYAVPLVGALPLPLGGPNAAHHLAASADLSTSLQSTRACANASAGILKPFRHSQTVAKQRTVQCSGGAEFPCRCRMGKRAC